jgi:hypothetical protein
MVLTTLLDKRYAVHPKNIYPSTFHNLFAILGHNPSYELDYYNKTKVLTHTCMRQFIRSKKVGVMNLLSEKWNIFSHFLHTEEIKPPNHIAYLYFHKS